MNITKATYGGVDCLTKVQSYINQNKLTIKASNNIIGDPSPGIVKSLEMEIDGITYIIREGDTFKYPKSTTNKLGIWYSNDTEHHPATHKSLETIQLAAGDTVDIVTCAWYPVKNNPFYEIYSWNKSSSHLNQLLQILQCIYSAKTIGDYKYISFLEHDVMYGEGYFTYPEFERGEVWTNINYGGINRDGWQQKMRLDEPMHQMTMHVEDAIEHFHDILGNALTTNSGFIETQKLTRKQWSAPNESIHINHGSHFTSHFSIYDTTNTFTEHPYWGNHSNYKHLFNIT